MKAIETHEQLLIFKIGTIACCVVAREVDSIVNAQKLHELPNQADFIAGVLQYRDSTVSIVNLFHKFSLETPTSVSSGRFIMAYTRHGITGFWVDEIIEITNDYEQNWSTPPSFIEEKVFDKTLLWKERLVLSTDFDRLFSMSVSTALGEWAGSNDQNWDVQPLNSSEALYDSIHVIDEEKRVEKSNTIISELITRGTQLSQPTLSVISSIESDQLTPPPFTLSELSEEEHSIGIENVFEDTPASNDDEIQQTDSNNEKATEIVGESATSLLGSAIDELEDNQNKVFTTIESEFPTTVTHAEDDKSQSEISKIDHELSTDAENNIDEKISEVIIIAVETTIDTSLETPADSDIEQQATTADAFLTSSSAILPTTSILSGEVESEQIEVSAKTSQSSTVADTELNSSVEAMYSEHESIAEDADKNQEIEPIENKVNWGSLKFGEEHESMFFIDDEQDENISSAVLTAKTETTHLEEEDDAEEYSSDKLELQVRIYQESIEKQQLVEDESEKTEREVDTDSVISSEIDGNETQEKLETVTGIEVDQNLSNSADDDSVFALNTDIAPENVEDDLTSVVENNTQIDNDDQHSLSLKSKIESVMMSELLDITDNDESAIEERVFRLEPDVEKTNFVSEDASISLLTSNVPNEDQLNLAFRSQVDSTTFVEHDTNTHTNEDVETELNEDLLSNSEAYTEFDTELDGTFYLTPDNFQTTIISNDSTTIPLVGRVENENQYSLILENKSETIALSEIETQTLTGVLSEIESLEEAISIYENQSSVDSENESVFQLEPDVFQSTMLNDSPASISSTVVDNEDQYSLLFQSHAPTVVDESTIIDNQLVNAEDSVNTEVVMNTEVEINTEIQSSVEIEASREFESNAESQASLHEESVFKLESDIYQSAIEDKEVVTSEQQPLSVADNQESLIFESNIEPDLSSADTTFDISEQASSVIENYENSEYHLDLETEPLSVSLQIETTENITNSESDNTKGDSSIFINSGSDDLSDIESDIEELLPSTTQLEESQSITSFLLEDYIAESSVSKKSNIEHEIETKIDTHVLSVPTEKKEDVVHIHTEIEENERDFSLVSEVGDLQVIDSTERELEVGETTIEMDQEITYFENNVEAYFDENIRELVSVYAQSIEQQSTLQENSTNISTSIGDMSQAEKTEYVISEVSEVSEVSVVTEVSEKVDVPTKLAINFFNNESGLSDENTSIRTDFVNDINELGNSEISELNTGDFENILLQSLSEFENEKSTISNTIFLSQAEDVDTQGLSEGVSDVSIDLESKITMDEQKPPVIPKNKPDPIRDVKKETAVKKVLGRIEEKEIPRNSNTSFRLVASILIVATGVFLYEDYQLNPSSLNSTSIRNLMLLSEEKLLEFKPKLTESRIEEIKLKVETVTEKFGDDVSVLFTDILSENNTVEDKAEVITEAEIIETLESPVMPKNTAPEIPIVSTFENEKLNADIENMQVEKSEVDSQELRSPEVTFVLPSIPIPLKVDEPAIEPMQRNFVLAPEFSTHHVVKGDTLWALAGSYLNNPFRYPDLARWSNIKNPDLIYPGNKVKYIPPSKEPKSGKN